MHLDQFDLFVGHLPDGNVARAALAQMTMVATFGQLAVVGPVAAGRAVLLHVHHQGGEGSLDDGGEPVNLLAGLPGKFNFPRHRIYSFLVLLQAGQLARFLSTSNTLSHANREEHRSPKD